jgi:protein subunit release factor B
MKEKVTILTRKDVDISYFVGSGAGGQNKQKNATGCQIMHKETGAIGRASDTRSADQNRRAAFRRLCATGKMKVWINEQIYKIRMGESMEAKIQREVDKAMAPENLLIETYDPAERF